MKILALVTLGLSVFLYLLINIYLFKLMTRSKNINTQELIYYHDYNCSDELLTNSFYGLVDSIGTLQVLSTITFLLVFGCAVFDLLSFAYSFKLHKKYLGIKKIPIID